MKKFTILLKRTLFLAVVLILAFVAMSKFASTESAIWSGLEENFALYTQSFSGWLDMAYQILLLAMVLALFLIGLCIWGLFIFTLLNGVLFSSWWLWSDIFWTRNLFRK